MADSPQRVYWDACTWIAYIQEEMPCEGSPIQHPRFEMCKSTIRRAAAGDIEIVTSAFTLAEVCKINGEGDPASKLLSFFDQPFLLIVNVDKRVGAKAQHLQLSGISGLKPPDAVHLASALVANVPVFHTFDERLLGLNEKLANRDGVHLRIVRPTEELPTPPLFEGLI